MSENDGFVSPSQRRNLKPRMKAYRLKKAREAEELLRKKVPVLDICDQLNISRKTIYNWRESGVLPKELFPHASYPEYVGLHPDLPAWLDLHYAGMSYRKIAEGYSVSAQRIHQIVKRYKKNFGILE